MLDVITNATTTTTEATAAFEARVRRHHHDHQPAGAPCVLDVSAKLILNYQQGSFALVAEDLAVALDAKESASATDALRGEACRLPQIFALRRELVNFKKACLRLFHDAQKLEKDLQRHEMFFFRDRDCDRWVEHGAVDPLYERACHWHQRAKGLLLAVHDARDLTKMLCALPRHPDLADEATPPRLLRMPASFGLASALGKAEAFLAAVGDEGGADAAAAGEADVERGDAERGDAEAADADADAADGSSGGGGARPLPSTLRRPRRLDVAAAAAPASASSLWCGLERTLDGFASAASAASAPHVLEYVRRSLVARGAAKAIAIHDGFLRYRDAMAATHARSAAALRRLDELLETLSLSGAAATAAATAAGASPPPPPPQSLEGRVKLVHATKHANLLRSAHAANTQLLSIAELLLDSTVRCDTSASASASSSSSAAFEHRRLFVASDSNDRGVAAMFVPTEFRQLSALLAEAADASRELDCSMRALIGAEGWPPPAEARRTRVSLAGDLGCWRCERRFSKQWAFRGVCWECEGALREAGACPFDQSRRGGGKARAGGRAAGHAFCPHQRKCAVCDGGFAPCVACGLAQGDGEAVAALCAEHAPAPAATGQPAAPRALAALFVDFDRTLCTTKSGGSPLQGSHSLDAELVALAAQLPTHVVTRNSHADEIRAFLAQRGMRVAGVHVVPRKESKAVTMLALCPALAPPPANGEAGEGTEAEDTAVRAIFVDDDVFECCDAAVTALVPKLLRVLFRRGAA